MKVKSAGTSGWGLYGTVTPSLDKGFVYITLTSEPYHYKRVWDICKPLKDKDRVSVYPCAGVRRGNEILKSQVMEKILWYPMSVNIKCCWCLGFPQGIRTVLLFGVSPKYQHTTGVCGAPKVSAHRWYLGSPQSISAYCWCLGCAQCINTLLVFGVPPRYQCTFRLSLLKWILCKIWFKKKRGSM